MNQTSHMLMSSNTHFSPFLLLLLGAAEAGLQNQLMSCQNSRLVHAVGDRLQELLMVKLTYSVLQFWMQLLLNYCCFSCLPACTLPEQQHGMQTCIQYLQGIESYLLVPTSLATASFCNANIGFNMGEESSLVVSTHCLLCLPCCHYLGPLAVAVASTSCEGCASRQQLVASY